ncbi:hypothetical protein [Bradyrhizobium sp. DASA03120]|uniref:hypothetical protein n=1 Tax=Bradyrhizobium sp. SMVTL-02 TaxID=3395917 RepID=UPI003F71589C
MNEWGGRKLFPKVTACIGTEILPKKWGVFLLGYLSLVIIAITVVSLIAEPKYSSRAVLPLTDRARALIKTEAILDRVTRAAQLEKETLDLQSARKRLSDNLDISELGSGSGLFLITFADGSPERAQAVLQQIITHVLGASKPEGTVRAALLQESANLKRASDELKSLAQTLERNSGNVKPGDEGERYARAFVSLVSDIAAKQNRIAEIERALQGHQQTDVVLQPTLATRADHTRLFAWLTISAILSLVVMFGLMVSRQQWLRRFANLNEPTRLPNQC